MADLIDFYINADTLANATAVFTDAEMTALAPSGYYSDGTTTKYQSNITGLGPSVDCPQCVATPCDEDIIFALPEAAAGRLQASIATDLNAGAIKVEINGVSNRPIGVDITFGGLKYNKFSSNLATNYTNVIEAPNSFQTSYFWSTGGVAYCNNWVNGNQPDGNIHNFPIYYYNPTLGSWYDSGYSTIISTTNRLTTGISQYTAGKLITYVPKNAGPQSLEINFDVPCGPSGSGPTLSVGCPTTLQSISTSISRSSHSSACGESISGPAYIGPVASTTPGVLAVKDWVFSDSNAFTKFPDGFYKASGTDLEGVSPTDEGTFEVVNGVVTQIQTC